MTILFILDTDHVSLFQRRHPQVIARIAATPPSDIAVTIITEELERTALRSNPLSSRWFVVNGRLLGFAKVNRDLVRLKAPIIPR